MKLEYKGAYRNHGQHTIHSSEEFRCSPNEWSATSKKWMVASATDTGITLRFDGTANLNRNADYEFKVSISDRELVELFDMRFGLEVTALDVKKEIIGEVLKQRRAAGLPSVRIPLLEPPSN